MQSRTRRELLLGGATLTAGLVAGCSGDGSGDDEDDPGDGSNGDSGDTADSGDDGESNDGGDSDGGGTPTASFVFEYTETSENRSTLEITHDGGDTIRASELYVRGSGFADVAEADMTDVGQWAGKASAEMAGEPAVAAGDDATLGVDSDYDMRVIWQEGSGSSSATLGADSGPDA